MIPDHWTLREWADKLGVLAGVLFAAALLLERARESARSEVKVALHNHRALHHCEPEGSDDE